MHAKKWNYCEYFLYLNKFHVAGQASHMNNFPLISVLKLKPISLSNTVK